MLSNLVVPNPSHKLCKVSFCINNNHNDQQQSMTRIRENKVKESNEYFQQFMSRLRDNRVGKDKWVMNITSNL